MDSRKVPFIRLFLVAAVLAMLFYMPTREFLKITFMLGIPFIFLLGYMMRQKKYSITWITASIVLIVILAGYG